MASIEEDTIKGMLQALEHMLRHGGSHQNRCGQFGERPEDGKAVIAGNLELLRRTVGNPGPSAGADAHGDHEVVDVH